MRAVRGYFEAAGFLEVETPVRVPSPGQEVHLEAIRADGDRWLITSPEYHMKRLVAAGLPRIFQIARAFRAGEHGQHHQPEFTLVEWYRADPSLDAVARDCELIVEAAARAVGRFPAVGVPAMRGGGVVTLEAPFSRTTVRELLRRHAGIDLRGDEPVEELRDKASAAGLSPGLLPPLRTAWDDVFFQIFLDRVEANLGRGRPTFVFDWPLPLGALARRNPDDQAFVERFELYAGGLELVNAFGELTDAAEQRARFVAEAEVRRAQRKAVYPIDEKLLAALPHMPPTCGAAMGFDRLVMLVLGAATIGDVVAFADEEA